ncbi:MAG: hypothetical protein Sapg2KO_28760 [Saprospiraceae bacterium]
MNFTEFILVLLIFTSFSCTFSLFEKEEKLLDELELVKHDKLSLYYVNFGVTTDNVIQLRRQKTETSTETLINVFPGYTEAKFLELNGYSVSIVLDNNFPGVHNIPDTLTIEIVSK